MLSNGGYGHHQSSSPHYSSASGSMNKFSPDPRMYLASSLYAPSGATSAYQISPARSRSGSIICFVTIHWGVALVPK